jgi:peptidoglycan/xylan/chitin deacetylase (PgdA/CDA1 family)
MPGIGSRDAGSTSPIHMEATQTIPSLLYHSIATESAPRFGPYALRPDGFRAHLQYLHDAGYTAITVGRLVRAMTGQGQPLPERPVVMTFDDAFADFYSHALPLLLEFRAVATMYVVSGLIGATSTWLKDLGEGGRPLLTAAQLRELPLLGIECGAHTLSHPQLDVISRSAARREIKESKDRLEQVLGLPVDTFAYPHGYHDTTVRSMVIDAGYSSASAVKNALSSLHDDRYALARILVRSTTTVNDLARFFSGEGMGMAPRRERPQTRVWRGWRRISFNIGQRRAFAPKRGAL